MASFFGARCDSLLSNMDDDIKSSTKKAIKEYKKRGGKLRLYIIDEAYYGNKCLLKNHFGLHTMDRGNCHSEFWRVYDEIVKGFNEWKWKIIGTNLSFEQYMTDEEADAIKYPIQKIYSSGRKRQ